MDDAAGQEREEVSAWVRCIDDAFPPVMARSPDRAITERKASETCPKLWGMRGQARRGPVHASPAIYVRCGVCGSGR